MVDILHPGEKIERIRKALGWSRSELGKRLDVSSQHIYNLEKCSVSLTKKRFHTLEKLVLDHISSQARMFDERYDDVTGYLESLRMDVYRESRKKLARHYDYGG